MPPKPNSTEAKCSPPCIRKAMQVTTWKTVSSIRLAKLSGMVPDRVRSWASRRSCLAEMGCSVIFTPPRQMRSSGLTTAKETASPFMSTPSLESVSRMVQLPSS